MALTRGLLLAALVLTTVAAQPVTHQADTLGGVRTELGITRWWWTGFAPWVSRPAGEGVVVGILDTGIGPHPDVDGALACPACAWSVVAGEPQPDPNGHGTAVAGVIAGRGHGQWNPGQPYWPFGLKGLAPEASLLVVRVADADGLATPAAVRQGMALLLNASQAPDIIVFSLTLGAPDPTLERLVREALGRGVVVVAPAVPCGNAPCPPADIPGVIGVAGVDARDQPVSERPASGVDLVAPGAVVVPRPGGGYGGLAGPGLATAVGAGLVALVMSGSVLETGGPARGFLVEHMVQNGGAAGLLSQADRGSVGAWWPAVTLLLVVLLLALTQLARRLLRRQPEP